ncbi:unnamed protein product [Protopolystoma xenopodis]|uniref:Uncharacterized protein n=1 Tax=Protopolystoma xenopodis TaxID=117903 RepID=A0A3S5CKA6_9PLAT|nr:unnamed protein product [Protopolystoma xenopodis]
MALHIVHYRLCKPARNLHLSYPSEFIRGAFTPFQNRPLVSGTSSTTPLVGHPDYMGLVDPTADVKMVFTLRHQHCHRHLPLLRKWEPLGKVGRRREYVDAIALHFQCVIS